jgi:hypothetical protein
MVDIRGRSSEGPERGLQPVLARLGEGARRTRILPLRSLPGVVRVYKAYQSRVDSKGKAATPEPSSQQAAVGGHDEA